MKTLRLYAPAIVVALWAVFVALGASFSAFALLVLAVAIAVHVQAEASERDGRPHL